MPQRWEDNDAPAWVFSFLLLGLLLCAISWSLVAPCAAQAQTFAVLYNFTGVQGGDNPFAGLLRYEGNLYGEALDGGSSDAGVLFEISQGQETVLYTFSGGDGAAPYGGLIRDELGNFYGTTYFGGSARLGVVFKLDATGVETVLHNFVGGRSDGCEPYAGVTRDNEGNLYGTTYGCGGHNLGTIYKVSSDGKETILHDFYLLDGNHPSFNSGLVMDASGNLYGVTSTGGDIHCEFPSGCGTVYELSKSGVFTVLHAFSGGDKDGCYSYGTPALDENDNLYGTAWCGSLHSGIIWKLSSNGTETVLHNFAGTPTDGSTPYTGVVLDANGDIYGITERGGAFGLGAVYKLSSKGTFKLLHSFSEADGYYPYGNIIRDSEGNLYGTTSVGGSGQNCDYYQGCGTAWELTP
jgi:uncharacterized repeat protein (TIGR03803 family)